MSMAFLLITAITVSIDSFFGGLSLAVKTKNKFLSLIGVVLAVFTICLLGSLLGNLFGKILKTYASLLSGLVLFSIGMFGVLTAKRQKESNKSASFFSSVIVGFSVGIDGAVGCFSLTSIGYNGILTCLLVTFVHAILMLLSFFITDKIPKKVKSSKTLPPLILIGLGIYKIITFLI